MFFVLNLVLVALAVGPSIASPVHDPEKRALRTCSRDNLYRIFIDSRYSSSASQFCSGYIAVTRTVSTTKTPGATITTTPGATATFTPTVTTSVTVPTTVTTVYVTSTETDGSTTTITVVGPSPVKRDIEQRAASITAPNNAGTYPPSRLSSACSCLVTPSTLTVTNTNTAGTSTSVSVAPTTTATVTGAAVTTVVTAFTDVTDTLSTVTTTTATTTSTVIGLPPSPALCGNAGLQFAFYNNPYYNYDPSYYSVYDPTVFKTQSPLYTGSTSSIGGIIGTEGTPISIYGGAATDPGYLAINHRGYLYAAQTGTYTFTSLQADEITHLWLGPLAYSGWTRANALQENVNNVANPVTTTVNLVAGQYYALRIMWANAQGPAAFGYSITAPDGTVLMGANTGPSDAIVQYSCDGVLAPPCPPFGSES